MTTTTTSDLAMVAQHLKVMERIFGKATRMQNNIDDIEQVYQKMMRERKDNWIYNPSNAPVAKPQKLGELVSFTKNVLREEEREGPKEGEG